MSLNKAQIQYKCNIYIANVVRNLQFVNDIKGIPFR